ncbi:phage tail protein [Vibrio cholerae]
MSIPESALNYGSILTLAGENAEINGKLNSKPINFTHIAIGDANDVYVQPSRTQTALVHELARIPITGMEKITPSKPDAVPQLKVWAKIPDDIVDIAVREFAAVATFDGSSYLHAVGNTVRIPILSGSNNGGEVNDIYIEMTFAVTSLDPIVMIDPTIVTATRKFVKDEDAKHLAAANPHPQYLSLTSYEKDALSFKQEWSALVNYSIGHEVVRNNLRYIARAASGPDNGGAVMPENNSGSVWGLVLPQAYSTTDASSAWIKIAEVNGAESGGGDFLSLNVIGGTDIIHRNRFSADIMITERGDAVGVIITPKTIDGGTNPEFYTKRISTYNFELWMKRGTAFSSPVTIIRNSRSRYSTTVAGILSITNTAPTDTTLVPYDTGYQFASIPIGMEVAFDTPPPTNDPRFRFVKLTHNDAYNTGLLTSQTLSGSAPELVSTAVISAAQSPINGQTIDMINTMGTFIRPGVTAGVRKSSQNKVHVHDVAQGGTQGVGAYSLRATSWTGTYMQTVSEGGDEANPYCLSRVFYKRIY